MPTLHVMDDAILTQTLETLIAFASVDGNRMQKDACLDWIVTSFLKNAPVAVERGEFADCPYLLINDSKLSWLWFAHIDVVPGRPDQFHLRSEGDRLHGRGVKDMKGAALPFLLAYRDCCVHEGEAPAVGILISTDEETGGKTIPMLLSNGLQTPIAFTPDTGSSPGVVVEHKGAAWLLLESRGAAGHAALPWEAVNPIPALGEAIRAIAKAYPPGAGGEWKMTVSITELSGSDAMNRIPATASAMLDVRYPPEEYSGARDVIAGLLPLLPEGCTLTVKEEGNPLRTDPEHPFIQRFLTTVEKVEGTKPPFIREHGATDARHFSAAGVPAFLYGPRGGGIHGDDEWVSLASLRQQYDIYRALFRQK